MLRARRYVLCLMAVLAMLPTHANAFIFGGDDCSSSENGYTQTQYPIVMAHGAFVDNIFGVIDYWYGIAEELQRCEGADVHVTSVSAFNSIELRGEQLLAQIEDILAATGKDKVNLIGHSMGGLDARYVMHVRPEIVASVTTVGVPNHGSGNFSSIDREPSRVMGSMNDFFGSFSETMIQIISGSTDPIDISLALEQLSVDYVSEWNETFSAGLPDQYCGTAPETFEVDGNQIYGYSWAGDNPAPFQERTIRLDQKAIDKSVYAALKFNDRRMDHPSDGLVDICSAIFGKMLKDDYDYNHFDLVNQYAGITSRREVDPVSLYRSHANRLKNNGL